MNFLRNLYTKLGLLSDPVPAQDEIPESITALECCEIVVDEKVPYIKLLNSMIIEVAKSGLCVLELRADHYSWFRNVHIEYLKKNGFVVSTFCLAYLHDKPHYISIEWSTPIEF